jgi:hypothetical protein
MKNNYKVQIYRNQCSNCIFRIYNPNDEEDVSCNEDKSFDHSMTYGAIKDWEKIHKVDTRGVCDDYNIEVISQ